MPQLPFDIPDSLASYAEHFEDDPIKATKRLKKQLKKRGPDAVGHFLLVWFYHLKGMDEQAVDEALKARIFAPGSPFFQKLHYYLSHPKAFEAWTPKTTIPSAHKSPEAVSDHGPVLNLDSLIQKLSSIEDKRVSLPKDTTDHAQKERNVAGDNVDDIVSETLAKIHENQGKIDAAIRTYERLKKLRADKKGHYNDQIARLRDNREEEET